MTLNLAVDVTYHVDRIERGETSRTRSVGRRAGGKGVNVARTLHALGREVLVTGFCGGFTGQAARAELCDAGIAEATVPIADESRLTFMLVEPDGTATGFSELGPEITAPEWRRLLERYGELLTEADAVVVSGSVPRGLPDDCYAQLVAAARRQRVPALLDADGAALALALATGPELVKINTAELEGVVSSADVRAGAAELREAGAGEVVISDGARGLTAVTACGSFQATPPEELRGNPTGAGDAASAALIAGYLDATPWPQRLADAAALSAAAVCAPLAGSYDEDTYRRLRRRISARPL